MTTVRSEAAHSGKDQSQNLRGQWMVIGIVVVSLLATCVMMYMLYTTMQGVFRMGIDERLKGLAGAASASFTPQELDRIGYEESIGTSAYEQAVLQLQHIRNQTPSIEYAYIFRQTDDPNTVEFVADADSLHPDQETDLNGDGIIDEEDALNSPGEPYDVTGLLDFQREAFDHPFVDPEFEESQWGIFIAGHAPIRDPEHPDQPTKYTIGLDLEITRYWTLLQRILIPFVGFAAFLLVVIIFLAATLRSLWKKQVTQMAELDRQKDELLSMVSHQLANPISAVKWNIEMMLDGDVGKLSEEQEKHLKSMYPQTQDLADLASMILDVSRIQLGRMKVDRTELDFSELVDEICGIVEQKAKEKKVKFVKELPKKMPKAMLDRRLTRMTLDNLLNNAVRYTEKGEVGIRVEMRDNMIHYEVRDTGCGIPKADQSKIFGKLFRASNVRDTEGNGFGLYVAKGAVESQGGTISFKSTEGKGTTFIVDLPIVKEKETEKERK